MTAAPPFTAAEQARLDAIEAAPSADEAVAERMARALLLAILGTTDGDVADDFEIHASEIARLIREHGAAAALAVVRTPVESSFVFTREDDGVMRCQGCHAIADADRRWTAGNW